MTMVKVKNRSQNERRTKNDRAPSTTTRAILPKRPRLKNLRLPRTARHSRRANRHASHRHQVLLIRARRRHHLLLPRKHRHRQRPHPPQRKSRLLLLCLPQTCPLLRRRNRPPLQRKSRLHLPRKFHPLRRANDGPELGVGSISLLRCNLFGSSKKGKLEVRESSASSFKNMIADTYRSYLSTMRLYTSVVGSSVQGRVDSLCGQ